MTLEVEAIRYLETDDGFALSGDQTVAHPMALQWTLELTESPRVPWRLAASNNPAEAIPGWS